MRERVRRLRAEVRGYDTEINRPGAFIKELSTYERMIAEKTKQRDREGNRVKCGPKCEALTKELLTLQAEYGTAKEIARAREKREIARAELVKAEEEAKRTPKTANTALAPIIKLVTIVRQNRNPDEASVGWGLDYFILALSAGITAVIFFGSKEHGRRLGPMPAAQPFEAPAARAKPQNAWLEAPEGHTPEPIPLPAEPAPEPPGSRSNHRVTRVEVTSDGDFDEAYQRVLDLINQAKSPRAGA